MPPLALDDETKLACREHPGVWFDGFGWVEDRAKKLRKADPANAIQSELFKIYCWCQDNGVPCNIIGLKSRKEGLSTGATALAYHHLSEHTAEAVVIGTDHETSDTLMRMLRRYAENDQFPWGSEFFWKAAENRGAWKHGSTVKRDTAIDPKAGRSSTVQVLIATEVAHWPTDGVRSADETMLSILNSMPDIANLLRIVDSTANGAAGWFYETHRGAVTFDERKAGRTGNGWVKVFEPWHSSPLRRSPATERERAEIMATLTDREQAGIIRFQWEADQIKWRRETLATKCGGDERKFDQEYPENEEVAFATSGSPRFNAIGLARLGAMADTVRKMSSHDPARPSIGLIDEGTGLLPKLVWTDDENGPHWIVEHPIVGCSYVGFCDPATGAQAEGSKTRDGASAGILRLAYTDESGVSHPDEPVAFLHGPNYSPVHWDNDIVVEAFDVLLRYYGDPPANVESNNAGVEVIRLLQMGGRTVCRRKRRDHKNPGKLTEIVGFQTNESSKRELIGALTTAIREQSLDCRYAPAVEQLNTFVVDEQGRGAAQAGKHDDHCIALGLALMAKHWAKRYEGARELANGPANWRGEEVRTGGAWS